MKPLTCDDIRQLLPEHGTLLDVRSEDEHDDIRFPGAVNIPLNELEAVACERLEKDMPILVHCLIGGRAAAAVEILQKMGFSKVSNIGGVEHYKDCNQLT